jgi:hypothetical protein
MIHLTRRGLRNFYVDRVPAATSGILLKVSKRLTFIADAMLPLLADQWRGD